MAKFETVAIKEAPRKAKLSREQLEERDRYEGYIQEVGEDTAGVLIPDTNEHIMSVRLKLAAAAKRLGVNLEVWTHEKSKVYFVTNGSHPISMRRKA